MDGHAPANPLRRSLPGADRVKPEKKPGSGEASIGEKRANLQPLRAQSAEPPDADPHVRWCGRGGAVRPPPIPIAQEVPPHGQPTPDRSQPAQRRRSTQMSEEG